MTLAMWSHIAASAARGAVRDQLSTRSATRLVELRGHVYAQVQKAKQQTRTAGARAQR
jgi:hypothetical protein